MLRTLRVPLLLLLVLAGGACTGRGRSAAQPAETTTLLIRNNSWSDMTIFVLYSGGTRQRLGLVNGNSSGTFRIPSSVVGMGRDLRFMADPVGSSNTAQSFNMFVRPGEEVRLTIPPTVR
ncbi:MAG TPA: hypothetical protein VEW03_00185 [Longimicrobiaceae bacterium]|nr:hypothetical protein [Longimicrobiaceae bacterium]